MELYFIFLLLIIIYFLNLNKKILNFNTEKVENFRNRHIKICNNPEYNEWRPGANQYYNYRSVVRGRRYFPFKNDKNKCQNKFNVESNNYNNLDFFSILYDAWLFSSKNKVKSSLKNEFYKNLKETLELACKIRGTEKYEFTKADLDNCIKNLDKGPDSFLVYYLLNDTSKICKKKHRPVALCKDFKRKIDLTIEVARNIRSNIEFVSRNYGNQSKFGNIWYDAVVRDNNDINSRYGN